MGFFRQEYWSGLSFHSPGDLLGPGIKSRSPALQEDSLPAEPPGKPSFCCTVKKINYVYTYIPSLLDLPPIPSPSRPSRPSPSIELSSLCYIAASHQLSVLHMVVYILEKAMATHSSVLAWRIPGMAEPGGLPSMVSHRVGHD